MEVKDGGRSNEISDENLPKFVSSHKTDINDYDGNELKPPEVFLLSGS